MKRHSLLGLLVFLLTSFAWPVAADNETLRIIAVDPPPGHALGTMPEGIVLTFNQDLLGASFNHFSVSLLQSGYDGVFDNGNEIIFGFDHTNFSMISPTQAMLDLGGYPKPEDDYQIRVRGDSAPDNEGDAFIMALEVTDDLLPAPELVEQIRADLAAIRQSYPLMSVIRARPPWAPGRLLVLLTDQAWFQFVNGLYHGLDELNAEFGLVSTGSVGLIQGLNLVFEQPYNPDNLAPFYAAADGVQSVHPDYAAGDTGDVDGSPPLYTFSMGWGDCSVGCGYRHLWDFSVVEGFVTLLAEYGDPLEDPLLPVVVSLDGQVLDGEFGGEFPSGDGIEGGDFAVEWPGCGIVLEGHEPTLIHYIGSFEVISGLLSELRVDRDFFRAECLGTFPETPAIDDLPAPLPSDGRYYLASGLDSCSDSGYGDSSTTPDLRDGLDGASLCP